MSQELATWEKPSGLKIQLNTEPATEAAAEKLGWKKLGATAPTSDKNKPEAK